MSPEHEKQLRLTLYELRSIHELGTLQRFAICIDQQAPTAVHAWGSHFYGCRCGCRKTGLSLERLQRDGIHVLLIPIEGATKHMGMQLPHMRYPSGAECALLNGLTPNLMWGQDARLGLCLVGQLASPLQSAWILTHVRQHLMHRGLLPHSKEGPSDVLAKQRTRLLAEAEQGGFFKFADNVSTASLAPVGETPYPVEVNTAPSQGSQVGSFTGVIDEVEQQISFREGCQIWHWVQAEMAFFPAGTKFFCIDAIGRPATLHDKITKTTWLKLDISEGEGEKKVVLPARILLDQVTPCIMSPQDVVTLRSKGPILEEKLAEIEDPGNPWGDDEIAWHLEQLAKDADSFVAWVDPLVLASHMVHDTALFLTSEGPFFRVNGWLLCVPFVAGHWLPLLGVADGDHVHFSVWDTDSTHFATLDSVFPRLVKLVGADTFTVTKYLRGATNLQSCGPDAIAQLHFALNHCMAPTPRLLEHISSTRHWAFVQHIRDDGTCQDAVLRGAGTQTGQLTDQVQELLVSRGVSKSDAIQRTATAMERIGQSKLQQAMRSPFPWSQLKVLGNQCTPPMRWILQHELEEQIRVKAASGQEVGNRAKAKKTKASFQAVKTLPPVTVRPDQIFVADQTFVGVNQDGSTEALKTISITTLGADATGVALCLPEQCRPYLSLQQPISKKALGLLALGEPRPELCAPRVTEVRFPAKRLGGMEPLLVNAVLVQIGDRPVQKYKPDNCMSLDILQTCVIRFALYRDEHPTEWTAVVDRPIRHLQDAFPPLQLCTQDKCGCAKWHSKAEAVPSPLLDVWSRSFLTSTVRPARPRDAEIFSVMARLPKKLLEVVIQASGIQGIYAEPREEDIREASAEFQVVWLPKQKRDQATVLSKQIPEVMGLARSGDRVGLRVQTVSAEKVAKLIRPDEVFVSAQGRKLFQIGPIPYGTQRQALAKALKEFGWSARPIQVVQSGFSVQGLHWSVQSTEELPNTVLHFRSSEAIITSVTSEPTQARHVPSVVAAKGTIAKFQPVSKSSSEAKDILQSNDPWARFQPSSSASSQVNVSQLVQHVKSEVLAKIPSPVSTAPGVDVDMTANHTEARISALEKKIEVLSTAQEQLQASTAKQAAATTKQLASINSKVDEQKSELKAMFDQQMNQIEQLLNKRARTD